MPDRNYNDKNNAGNPDLDAFEDKLGNRKANYLSKSDSYGGRSSLPYYGSEGNIMDDKLEELGKDPISKRRDSKTGCLGGLMYFIFIVSISVILACVGWMAASDVLALNKEELSTEVTLPEEIFTEKERDIEDENGNVTGKKKILIADISEVAGILKDAGIIEYKSLFKLYSAISDANEKIDPGTYELSTEYDYRAIVKKMQFGSDSQVRTKVTFPEGFTMEDMFKRLEENKVCKYDDLMECAANVEFSYKFLEGIPLGDAKRLEGFLFPDTYEFYQGMTAQAAIDTFLNIFNRKFTAEMWDLTSQKGLTVRDVINIASMIEKEAANDEERPKIASVIYNRINTNMLLGIDATIYYILPEHKEALTLDDLAIDSPYNTRKYTGLPPTPIANPGISSIMAALKPASTNYYYYTLDEATKTHRFFTNKKEHDAFASTQSYS
ncbi:MAG: endolytic transglycosylase MltG [Clostridiales bacterium]|nr:endolytic transglycosylase MltG [Clostridiales bacterium]